MIVKNERENAVSPVIGVMMMLVVTILIAAVVTMFASGMTDSSEPAPTISVKLDGYILGGHGSNDWTIPEMTFKHMSGDSIDLDTIRLEVMYNFATKSFTDLEKFDSNGDGKWTPGESITIYESGYGKLYSDPSLSGSNLGFTDETMYIPEDVTVRFVTKSGEVICETDVTITFASATKIYESYSDYPVRS